MPEDSAADSFFVPDGQLSDDEGLSSAQQGVDDLCADQLGKPHTVPPDIRMSFQTVSYPFNSFGLDFLRLLPGSHWGILMCCLLMEV